MTEPTIHTLQTLNMLAAVDQKLDWQDQTSDVLQTNSGIKIWEGEGGEEQAGET